MTETENLRFQAKQLRALAHDNRNIASQKFNLAAEFLKRGIGWDNDYKQALDNARAYAERAKSLDLEADEKCKQLPQPEAWWRSLPIPSCLK